jgi:hypothetical protein
MSWLTAVPIIGRLFSDTAEIVKKAVTDKDLQNKLIYNLEELQRQVDREIYVKELETRTIPWVDALHKMGRQNLALICVIATVGLMILGYEITPTVAAILGAPTITYNIIKGKGK